MDRIERIGPRPSPWQTPPLDPDREDVARRRREQERRRREQQAQRERETPPDDGDGDGPHIDVRV